MSTLLDKANEIKRQKDTYLLPENLKEGVTCLGVTGTLPVGSSQVELRIQPIGYIDRVEDTILELTDTNSHITEIPYNIYTNSYNVMVDKNITLSDVYTNIKMKYRGGNE